MLWPLGPRRALCLADGVVDPDAPEPRAARPGDPAPEPGLILPAFADWHFHWVQMGIAGRHLDGAGRARPLLEWLTEVAWPEESRFADSGHTAAALPGALDALAAAGTAAGAAWASPHAGSASAFLSAAPDGFLCGPAVMTAGPPAALARPLGAWLADLDELHRHHGARLVVTPRFALSTDAAGLAALGAFARERGLVVQTHLAENEAEVRVVRARFPGAADYTDVYDRAGLLGPRTLLAHAVHVSDRELAAIAAAGSVVVHCPSSNRALGSGRMPLERLRAAGVRWVLGSDVGAGPALPMLDAMAAAADVHGAADVAVAPSELLHRATLGPAAVFGGASERDVPPALRPGALVVDLPAGLDLSRPDADAWTRALLDDWRARRAIRIRRPVRWPVK